MNLPNSLTILRIVLTPLFIILFLHDDINMQVWGILIFTIASLTDWFDGYYARKTNTITRFGQFMDPLADKVLNLAASYLMMLLGYVFEWILFSIMLRDIFVTMLRLYALKKNQAVITSRLAQWKTFIHMTLLISTFILFLLDKILHIKILELTASYSSVMGIAWVLTAVLSLYTLIDYIIENRNHIIQLWRSFLSILKLI